MKRVFDYIRDDCYRKGYGVPFNTLLMPSHDYMKATQWSASFERAMRAKAGDNLSFADEFVQLMKNRLIMGPFRYGGLLADERKAQYDRVGYALAKIRSYCFSVLSDLDIELLVDAANCLLLEWVEGTPLSAENDNSFPVPMRLKMCVNLLDAYQVGAIGRPALSDTAARLMEEFDFHRRSGAELRAVDDHPVHAQVVQ